MDSPEHLKPVRIEDLPWKEWSEGERFGSRVRQLSPPGPEHHVGVIIEELPPGRQSCPVHYHLAEEEHVLMLEGSVTLRLGAQRYTLNAGDYVCFPAGQQAGHALINEGSAVCRYLVIGEHIASDVAVYPDSDKVYVRSLKAVFPRAAEVDYWKGELPSA
ncbi:MAG: cupin domain-containing protein [Burkholderiaceae bacterium]|jgi:uncharacterized cupin superfamily protein